MGEGNGNSVGVGYLASTWATASGGQFQYSGAPEPLNGFLSGTNIHPNYYLYAPAGRTVSGHYTTGLILSASHALNIAGNLRFHTVFGQFEGSGVGSFRPAVRMDAPPYANLVWDDAVSTRTGVDGQWGLARTTLDLPAASRPFPLGFRLARAGQDSIVGPFLAYYVRCENTDKTQGAAYHSLFGMGGGSVYDMASALIAAPDLTLTTFFYEVRLLQSGVKRVLVRVNAGLNDRNEQQPSVNNGYLPGNSAQAFGDNCQAIIDRIQEIWTLNGWDTGELFFVFTVSHPIATPDDAVLLTYRAAAETLALTNPRTATARFDALTSATEMAANAWYQSPTDSSHLRAAGFDALAARELAALMAAAVCPSDIDADGDADSDDITVFFNAWDQGEITSDFDGDGDTDSDDIVVFFGAWDSGC